MVPAQEPDTRISIEPWGGGARLTIEAPGLATPLLVTISNWRWRQLMASIPTDGMREKDAVPPADAAVSP
jgi:hypothetical protein